MYPLSGEKRTGNQALFAWHGDSIRNALRFASSWRQLLLPPGRWLCLVVQKPASNLDLVKPDYLRYA